ncbi:MAG TPA: hypothetical protein VHK86_03780 [Nitrososphaera sp.]|jgi:hypothetical protein|nr:hypothetical protein [Nitrososphaera sp.]
MLAAWNNWNTIIPSFMLRCGIIFQLWNNLSMVRNIPDKKLFHDLDAYWHAWYGERRA